VCSRRRIDLALTASATASGVPTRFTGTLSTTDWKRLLRCSSGKTYSPSELICNIQIICELTWNHSVSMYPGAMQLTLRGARSYAIPLVKVSTAPAAEIPKAHPGGMRDVIAPVVVVMLPVAARCGSACFTHDTEPQKRFSKRSFFSAMFTSGKFAISPCRPC
jgi:hypothetical protein